MTDIDGLDGTKTGEEGNAKPSSRSKTTQLSQRINWHFRFSNYETHHIDGLDSLFSEICSDWIFQEEVGCETGTPHLQGAIRLKRPMRYTEFTPDKRIHWEPQKSLNNANYCSKDATRKEGGRVCYGGSYKPKNELRLLNPAMFYDWQKDVINIINTEPDDRAVYWYWSSEGNKGKSSFVKYLIAKHKATPVVSGKYSDICNLIHKTDMDCCRLIVFDIPRNNGNNVSYSAIESIKNGMIVNTKYETGFKIFNPPHVIIFCNEPPETHKLSDDRWNIVNID